jgi:Domain of unknown function (DUF4349)
MRLTDEQIGAELRALREIPTEDFAAQLDAWAAAGFPPRDSKTQRPAGERRSLRFKGFFGRHPVLAGAAGSLAVVLAIGAPVATVMNQSGTGDSDRGGGADFAAPAETDSAGSGAEISGAAGKSKQSLPLSDQAARVQDQVAGGEQLKPGRERVQERTASLSLSAEPSEVDDVADGVVDVTDRYDGIVVSSQVSTADGTGRATFDLRIPTQNLQAALADLSDLAHVASRDEGTLDITAPFVAAEERHRDAKATVDSLLDRLADADSATEIEAIRAQLRSARQELAAARSELAALKQRADFSRLSVAVIGNGEGDGSWSIGEAADDAVDVLEAVGGAILIGLAVVVPVGAIGGAFWLGAREFGRRRREATLDR